MRQTDRQSQSPSAPASPGELQPIESVGFSIDANADRLMDEVFEDVERMLDRGVQIPIEPSQPPSAPVLQMPTVSNLAVSPKLSPRQLTLGESEPDADLLLAVQSEPGPPEPRKFSFTKLLLAVMGVSLVGAGLLWYAFEHGLLQRFWPSHSSLPSTSTAIAPAVTTPEQQNQPFLDYVHRSLDRIDRVTEANRQAAALAKEAGTPSAAATPAPTVLERVYIPVPMYQPSPATPSAVAVLPSPVAPAAPATSAPTAPATAVPNIAQVEKHVLIGIMELGSRSAALFEIDGTPRRIQAGEAIGSSGWMLVSINNQEAIVRRNGEVRSIYVGQQF